MNTFLLNCTALAVDRPMLPILGNVTAAWVPMKYPPEVTYDAAGQRYGKYCPAAFRKLFSTKGPAWRWLAETSRQQYDNTLVIKPFNPGLACFSMKSIARRQPDNRTALP